MGIAEHISARCPYSKAIWDGLPQKLFLLVVPCDSPFEMILSILNQLDPNHRELQTLIFLSYLWHIWRERNARVFQNKSSPPQDILHAILNKIRSRITFLWLSLLERENSCWGCLQRHHIRRFIREIMRQIIVVFLYHICILFWLGYFGGIRKHLKWALCNLIGTYIHVYSVIAFDSSRCV